MLQPHKLFGIMYQKTNGFAVCVSFSWSLCDNFEKCYLRIMKHFNISVFVEIDVHIIVGIFSMYVASCSCITEESSLLRKNFEKVLHKKKFQYKAKLTHSFLCLLRVWLFDLCNIFGIKFSTTRWLFPRT